MNGGDQERAAINRLCREYWKPVASCIAAKGAPSERVDDLTQEFFMQMVDKGFFKRADREKGRFRSFMLGSLRFFLADDVKHQMSQKKGGHLEQSQLMEDSATVEVDDARFDRAWAEVIFEKVLGSVKKEMKESRGSEVWEVLKRFLPGEAKPPTYADLADVMNVSESGAKSEVFRLRQRFRTALRSEVALTVSAPHEVDEELAHLREALSGSSALS